MTDGRGCALWEMHLVAARRQRMQSGLRVESRDGQQDVRVLIIAPANSHQRLAPAIEQLTDAGERVAVIQADDAGRLSQEVCTSLMASASLDAQIETALGPDAFPGSLITDSHPIVEPEPATSSPNNAQANAARSHGATGVVVAFSLGGLVLGVAATLFASGVLQDLAATQSQPRIAANTPAEPESNEPSAPPVGDSPEPSATAPSAEVADPTETNDEVDVVLIDEPTEPVPDADPPEDLDGGAPLQLQSVWDEFDHAHAEAFCGQLASLGDAPWRLPTADELVELAESGALGRYPYWSSTPDPRTRGRKYVVFNGTKQRLTRLSRERNSGRTACVRRTSS